MADWRSRFEVLVVPLNLVDLLTVVGEQKLILSVQRGSQVFSVEDRFKLPKELQRIINGHGSLEFLMDVSLEVSLNGRDIDVEGDEISIKLVVRVLKKSVLHHSETLDEFIKGGDDVLDVLELVLAKSSELLDSTKELHELTNSSAEEIEATKDLLR